MASKKSKKKTAKKDQPSKAALARTHFLNLGPTEAAAKLTAKFGRDFSATDVSVARGKKSKAKTASPRGRKPKDTTSTTAATAATQTDLAEQIAKQVKAYEASLWARAKAAIAK